jgi:hypothetical protein
MLHKIKQWNKYHISDPTHFTATHLSMNVSYDAKQTISNWNILHMREAK